MITLARFEDEPVVFEHTPQTRPTDWAKLLHRTDLGNSSQRSTTLLSLMQSDRNPDNYTNSELEQKSEIEKNDKCISKQLLDCYQVAIPRARET
jgi:hypothetical protein